MVTQSDWERANRLLITWWRETYPGLKEKYNVDFPIPDYFLRGYYMNRLAIEYPTVNPNPAFLNNYDYLLAYFLENSNREIVKGKNYLDFTAENLPGAISKTFKDIVQIVPMEIWLLFGGYILFQMFKD